MIVAVTQPEFLMPLVLSLFNIDEIGGTQLFSKIELPINFRVAKLILSGHQVFISNFIGKTRSIDFSDPANPQTTIFGESTYDFALKDETYLYNLEAQTRVQIRNVVCADSIYMESQLILPENFDKLHIQDSTLYALSRSANKLSAFSLADPTLPQHIGDVSFPGSVPTELITSSANTLFVSSSWGIRSFDITTPSTPLLIDSLATPESFFRANSGMAYVNNNLITSHVYGLQVFDVSNPSSLVATERYYTGGVIFDADIEGNLAFATSGISGLSIIDISDPTQPTSITTIQTGGGLAREVLVEDDVAYVLNFANSSESTLTRGLWIVDIADPYNPGILSHFPGISYISMSVGQRSPIIKSGDYIILSGNDRSFNDSLLQIIDVSNPSDPQGLGVFEGAYVLIDVAVSDSFIYALGGGGMHIVDWSDPTNPVEVGFYNEISSNQVEVHEDNLFLLSDSLYVFSIADPISPALLGQIKNPALSTQSYIVANDSYLYWSFTDIGVVDITNPAAPIEKQVIEGEPFMRVATEDNLVVGAELEQGLRFYRNNSQPVGIRSQKPLTINSLSLEHNYPNPFNPSTKIRFSLAAPTNIKLQIVDVNGRHVRNLVLGQLNFGFHNYVWDGRNESGTAVASGIYFYRLIGAGTSLIRKMVLIR